MDLTNSIVSISLLVASSLVVPSPTGGLFVNHRAFGEIAIENLVIDAQCSEFTFMTYWQLPLGAAMVNLTHQNSQKSPTEFNQSGRTVTTRG